MPTPGYPNSLTAVPAKVVEDGATPIKLLQPKNQSALQAIGAAYSQAEVTALRDCLVNAGLMKAS